MSTAWKGFLKKGNGHQSANRQTAMHLIARLLPDVEMVDEATVRWAPYGLCHFHAFTEPTGAMISSTGKDDNIFGSVDWHYRDHTLMVRDPGDGRCIVYVCPIEPLFALRTIGAHGVRWEDVRRTSIYTTVLQVA